jgi:nicotinamidase-related amidase
MNLELDSKTTALIAIDLQKGIVARPMQPHESADVVKKTAALADRLRRGGGTIVYVRVDMADVLKLPVDAPMRPPGSPAPSPEMSELVPEAGKTDGDLLITKRQWGAFFGTDLESQLLSRGIKTVVMTGIATNFGVESTARASAGLGFATVFVEDAMSSVSAEAHRFAIENIFPRLGRVRTADQIVFTS